MMSQARSPNHPQASGQACAGSAFPCRSARILFRPASVFSIPRLPLQTRNSGLTRPSWHNPCREIQDFRDWWPATLRPPPGPVKPSRDGLFPLPTILIRRKSTWSTAPAGPQQQDVHHRGPVGQPDAGVSPATCADPVRSQGRRCPQPRAASPSPRTPNLPGLGNETKEIDNVLTKKHEVVHTYGWYMSKMIAEAKQGAQCRSSCPSRA